MRKKLTNSSAASIVFCIAALLISGAAAASEFIGRYTYSQLFGKKINYVVTNSSFAFFESYSKVILLTCLCAVFLIILFASARVKKLGAFEPLLVLCPTVLLGVFGAATIYSHIRNGGYADIFSLANEDLFMFVFKEGIEWATVIGAFFLFLSCLAVFIRLKKETFCAETVLRKSTSPLAEPVFPTMVSQYDAQALQKEAPDAPSSEQVSQSANEERPVPPDNGLVFPGSI